jgi:hypothetical protein
MMMMWVEQPLTIAKNYSVAMVMLKMRMSHLSVSVLLRKVLFGSVIRCLSDGGSSVSESGGDE